jgi:hypothetical protein
MKADDDAVRAETCVVWCGLMPLGHSERRRAAAGGCGPPPSGDGRAAAAAQRAGGRAAATGVMCVEMAKGAGAGR